MSMSFVFRFALSGLIVVFLAGCLGDVAPHTKQLPAEAQALLAKKGMRHEAPIFIRIFKEESELEIWKQMDDGRYELFKTYPICAWSGTLGPKVKQGDKQAPEGFYTVTPGLMNPNSQFHLAFNLGFPNAYDKAHGRTGSALMVHGKCKSAGCFAMTDALIEEIYILARESFNGGQTAFHVHAFPFRLTEDNLTRHRSSEWYPFWRSLKAGYDAFEFFRVPPKVAICSRQYLVNVEFMGHTATPDPQGPCPAHQPVIPDPISGFENLPDGQIASKPAAGPRTVLANHPAATPPVPDAAAVTTVQTAPVTQVNRDGEADARDAAAREPEARDTVARDAVAADAASYPAPAQQARRGGKGDMLTIPPQTGPTTSANPANFIPNTPANFGYAPANRLN